jgi:cell division protein FtsX
VVDDLARRLRASYLRPTWRRVGLLGLVTVFVVSAALLGATLIKPTTSKPVPRAEVTVWLQPGASQSESLAVATELGQSSDVRGCVYRSQLADYRQAKRLLSAARSSALTVQATPAGVRCSLEQPHDGTSLVDRFSGRPGVLQVVESQAP